MRWRARRFSKGWGSWRSVTDCRCSDGCAGGGGHVRGTSVAPYMPTDFRAYEMDPFSAVRGAVENASDACTLMVFHPGYIDAYLMEHSTMTTTRTREAEYYADSPQRANGWRVGHRLGDIRRFELRGKVASMANRFRWILMGCVDERISGRGRLGGGRPRQVDDRSRLRYPWNHRWQRGVRPLPSLERGCRPHGRTRAQDVPYELLVVSTSLPMRLASRIPKPWRSTTA